MNRWVTMCFAAAAIGLTGCPSDGNGTGDGDTADDDDDDTGNDDDDDDDDDDTSASSVTVATGESSSGGESVDTGTGTDTGDTGDTGTDTGDTGTESGETTSGELCMIDLPPPEECKDASPPSDGFTTVPATPLGGLPTACDIFLQDCPEGEKCNPYSNDGGNSWNATGCFPLDPAPVDVGGDCTVEGSGVSGIDNCAQGSMCWSVDAETNMGYCLELCSCTEVNPVCNTPNTTCTITNDGILPLCLNVCNPADPAACPEEEVCIPSGDYFLCAPDASGDMGAVGDPCEFINVCDPGLFCANAASVPGCTSDIGCCSSLCVGEDAGNCEVGQECVPWYEEGAAPDDCLGTVGACSAQ